jgi:hypothetical protein
VTDSNISAAITDENSVPAPGLQPLWHHKAPRELSHNLPGGEPNGNWPAWTKHLARRKQPVAPKFFRRKDPAILWGWPKCWHRDELGDLFASLHSKDAVSATSIAEIAFEELAGPPDLPIALQLVALAYALPELARDLPAQKWWQTVEALHEIAREAQLHRVDWPADPLAVLRQQLLAGELPLALRYMFPELRALRALGKPARAVLSEGLIVLTDGEGLPHGRLWPVLAPLFACWTRCRRLGQSLNKGSWSREAEHQYEWLVRNAIRLSDADGRFLLTPIGETRAWSRNMLMMALELSGDRRDSAAAAVMMSPRNERQQALHRKVPEPSLNSDWSGIAVLASGWSQSDARLALAYAEQPLGIELSTDGERAFVGTWDCLTKCDGASVEATGEWERLCWETGKRFDYLELGIDLSHGLRLERQVLLGRADLILYLADNIIAGGGGQRHLQHSMRLPLDAAATWRPEFETRDGLLAGDRMRVAVMPMALAEWRSDPRGGSLYVEDGRLVLAQEAHGRAVCCPLFFDLSRKRAKQERTWRQLTVAEWMEILPRDVAVGYRAQSGADQWLFYRSLGPCGNRSVLGQNIAGEFTAGRFLESGKFKDWVEIENA